MNARWERGSLQSMGNLSQRIKQIRQLADLSQEKFAEAIGEVEGVRVTRGAVGNWEHGGGISRANLTAISDVFGVSLDWLEKQKGPGPSKELISSKVQTLTSAKNIVTGTRQTSGASETLVHNAELGSSININKRLPILGYGMAGEDGVLIFEEGRSFGDTDCPPKLNAVPDAYAAKVVGDSMLDRYEHGEVVFVNPWATPRKGQYVIAQISKGEGEPYLGYIKRFVSRDDKVLKLEQLNPKKFLTFPISQVKAVHLIIMGGME
jgi:phage repressor protein C with HTH and peptisase S24 domain